jgi:single-strand DNA-binding protein
MTRRKSTNTASEIKVAPAAEAAQDRVTFIGRLCADPVLRHTKSGKSVTTIRVAVNAPEAGTTFHSVVVWNRTAEVVCEYLRKGRLVTVVGRKQERSYQDADGNERQVNEIVAFRIRFLSRQATAEKEVA